MMEEGMDQIKTYCKHMSKCHNETPTIKLIYATKKFKTKGRPTESSIVHPVLSLINCLPKRQQYRMFNSLMDLLAL
jgi:hypothetical protein